MYYIHNMHTTCTIIAVLLHHAVVIVVILWVVCHRVVCHVLLSLCVTVLCVGCRHRAVCHGPSLLSCVTVSCTVRCHCDAMALAIHVTLSSPFLPAIAVVVVTPWHWPSASRRHRSHQPLLLWSLSGCCGHTVVVALAICILLCRVSSPSLSS